jgi:hypothetical protein
MTSEDKKFVAYWEKVQFQGRWVYALKHGAIFGFGVFILINVFLLANKSVTEVYFTRQALEQMLTMVLAGIVGYGTFKYWFNQKLYKKILSKDKDAGDQN